TASESGCAGRPGCVESRARSLRRCAARAAVLLGRVRFGAPCERFASAASATRKERETLKERLRQPAHDQHDPAPEAGDVHLAPAAEDGANDVPGGALA